VAPASVSGRVVYTRIFACDPATALPIVGIGGVTSGRDALELIACGATTVSLGTVLFGDPEAPARIRAELAAEVAAFGLTSPDEARGIAHEIAIVEKPLQISEIKQA